jgi:hypothetical protein
MKDSNGGAPSWLFSFVDLAFLMLIAMTQLAPDPTDERPDLGELVVPRIAAESTNDMPSDAAKAWQVRVHPPGDDAHAPFELLRLGDPAGPEPALIGDAATLRERLAVIRESDSQRPVLAPHEDSRSQDMLDAAAAIEDLWPGRRRVAVARVASTAPGAGGG